MGKSIRRAGGSHRPALWAALIAMLLVATPMSAAGPLTIPEVVAAEPVEPSVAESTPTGVTLNELESIALSRNPALARAASLISAARGEFLQVGLKPNPYVGYEGQQLGSGGLAEQHGVVFGQEVVTGGKLRLSRAVASRRVEIAEQELSATRLRVLTDVRVAFYRVLVAERQLALADELITLSSEVSKSVDALLQAKEVGRVDLLQANLERQQAEVFAVNSRQRLDASWRGLAAVVSDPGLTRQPLLGDPTAEASEFSFEDALVRIQSASPEAAVAAAEVQRARASLARERVEPLPNVTFQGLVNWRDNGIGGGTDGGVALTVPVPLFNRNQGAILRAERELAAAQHAIRLVDLDLQQRLAPVFEAYSSAQQQAAAYRESILPQAQESLQLTRAMYQAGEVNYTGLLVAQRTFAYTNRDYLDAVLRLREAEAAIEGLLLSGSLASPTGPESYLNR